MEHHHQSQTGPNHCPWCSSSASVCCVEPHLCRVGSALLCCQCSGGGSAGSSHATCLCLAILSNTSSRFRSSFRMTASNGAFQSSARFRLTLQQASPRVSFVVLFVLSRSRWPPLLSCNLKMALVSSTSVRPPSVGCVSFRIAMTANPLRPLTALLETIAQARSIFAATVRQEWVCPSLPDVVHLFGRVKPGRAWVNDLSPPDLFRRFQQELGQEFHPLCVKALMALEELVQWRCGNWYSFQRKVLRLIVAMLTERL